MRNLLKITAIFLSSILFFISIITERYCFGLNSKTLTSSQESLSSHLPLENPDLFLINRYGEKLVSSIKNLPVFNIRNQAIEIHSNILSCEPGKLRTESEYLRSSETISRNLTTSDIVFPSHYFW